MIVYRGAVTANDALAFTEMLWPEPERGPWYVRVWWGDTGRLMPEPIGLWLWKGAVPDTDDPTLHAFRPIGDGPQTITATDVDGLPVGAILASLRKKARQHEEQYRAFLDAYPTLPAGVTPDDLKGDAQFTTQRRARGRPPEYGPAHYERVATVYRDALNDGDRAATRAVMREFPHASRRTVSRWIAKAADLGLLGAAERRGLPRELLPRDNKEQQ